MSEARIFSVVRPGDGAVVPLTCTDEQFNEYWKPLGYELVSDAIEQPVQIDIVEIGGEE